MIGFIHVFTNLHLHLILHTFVLTESQEGYPRKNLWNKRKKLGWNHSGNFSPQFHFHDLLLLSNWTVYRKI